ncbi:MAG: para-aminobenzoate synthetase component 1, partial [Saprospiraceae bacterium]
GNDDAEDLKLKQQLSNNPKERSENIMIVDLVRNDLSQVAQDGSVVVDELCGVYTFPHVHQLISTVSCEVKEGLSSTDLIQKCFPMGSMTGAPKVKAMELIEKYEETKRGIYSGSIGYFSPDGDFDFNVVIRSILYNAKKEYLSFSVGGAITHQSEPEQEYEETLLKAKGMIKVLG